MVALVAAPLTLAPVSPASAQIGIGFHVTIAPPILPVYDPPPLPGPGYIFTPGYWAYGDAGYYWVPGTWVQPPNPGLLWTPGYWGYEGGVYQFNAGYWGPHVGYYGGINYGFGYVGTGFFGGEWRGGGFFYNTAAFGIGVGIGGGFGGRGNIFGNVHNTYVNNTVIVNHTTINHISYNGPGGIQARPTAEEERFSHEAHVQPTATQMQHVQLAAHEPALRASVNHGAPAIAATARPAEFKGPGVVQAHAAGAEAARPGEAARTGEAARPGVAHPGTAGAAHAPGAVAHGVAPHARAAGMPAVQRPAGAVHPMGERPVSHPMAAPHPMGGMGRPMGAPHPMAAPRPAARPAPHPSGGGRPEHHR
jgi:hypothetical protein